MKCRTIFPGSIDIDKEAIVSESLLSLEPVALVEERNMIRQLIGPKGENIEKILKDLANVQISFSDLGMNSDIVKLRGPKEDVEKATKLLKEMSEEKQLSGVTMEIRAKPQHHKFLVGKAGIHIQQIKDDTGAR